MPSKATIKIKSFFQQPSLNKFVNLKKKFSAKNPKQIQQRKLLALLPSTSVPNSIVDSADFQAFVDSLNARFHIPRRTSMTTDIIELHKQCQKILKRLIDSALSKKILTGDSIQAFICKIFFRESRTSTSFRSVSRGYRRKFQKCRN